MLEENPIVVESSDLEHVGVSDSGSRLRGHALACAFGIDPPALVCLRRLLWVAPPHLCWKKNPTCVVASQQSPATVTGVFGQPRGPALNFLRTPTLFPRKRKGHRRRTCVRDKCALASPLILQENISAVACWPPTAAVCVNFVCLCVTRSCVVPKGLRELDRKERRGGDAACAGDDQPPAVFHRFCSGLFPPSPLSSLPPPFPPSMPIVGYTPLPLLPPSVVYSILCKQVTLLF